MKKKSILISLCAAVALCAVPLAFAGCAKNEDADFGEWITVTAPTCEEAGVEIRTSLSDPNVKQTRVVPATGHDWNGWETQTEATCLLAGVETRTCNTCENSDKRAIPALGHSWGAWETTLEADCENEGAQTRVCLRDENHTELRSVANLGHDFGEWVITLSPTCTVAGVETRYCRNCNNHTEVRAVEPYGHEWSAYATTKAATCTEDGAETSVCANDATHIKTHILTARGHKFGDWVVSVPATESQSGEDVRVCVRDALHTETRASSALGSDGLLFKLNSAGTEYSVHGNYDRELLKGTVYIPDTYKGLPVTKILNNAFSSCNNIERVVFLGNNIKSVGTLAFNRCNNLESVDFSEGITSFDPHTFAYCPKLKSISFPSTAVSIGKTRDGRFISIARKCPALESITVAEGNPVYRAESGCLIERATNTLLLGTKNAVIPSSVTKIEGGAFYGSSIESVNIHANIESIGSSAFSGCESLKELTFENGKLTVIGLNMYTIFGGCTSLERIVLPENLTAIQGHAFRDCTSLKEVVFGNNLQTIDNYAFSRCENLTVCNIPASVTSISPTAFSAATIAAMTIDADNPVYFKDNNCIIERETNKLIAGVDYAVIPDYVTFIGNYAFENRNFESITIPANVTGIGAYAFRGCASLKTVTFEGESKLEAIGEHAFDNCTSLTSIMLPLGLRAIRSSAFDNCSALTSVTFGERMGGLILIDPTASSLESIGNFAFSFTQLKSFVIPKTVTEIGYGAFESKKLTSLTVVEGNAYYKMQDGCLIEIATQKVLVVLSGGTVPDTAKIIASDAFYTCTDARIVIPASVEEMNSSALFGLTSAQTVVIKGFASQEEADAVWGKWWHTNVSATIIYEG